MLCQIELNTCSHRHLPLYDFANIGLIYKSHWYNIYPTLCELKFYDLNKTERVALVAKIHADILHAIVHDNIQPIKIHSSSEDTYVRKSAYLAIGRIYDSEIHLRARIISCTDELTMSEVPHIRQTAINAAGEIGKKDFASVGHFFDRALFDPHHTVRNAVIGSVKKMSEVNPEPVLTWAKKYLHHPDKEVRREICHGIELRGRTHPEDILPLLRELENDPTARVRNTLIHVLGQIAYKKNCLEIVVADMKKWQNSNLVKAAFVEIVDVHHRYRNFAHYSQEEASKYIDQRFPSS